MVLNVVGSSPTFHPKFFIANKFDFHAHMVDVVQLVRASDCGSECRGFESHLPPRISLQDSMSLAGFLVFRGLPILVS